MAVASIALLNKSANWWSDLVLFVAGLSILIDLFEPAALRRLGARARERASAARNIRVERRTMRDRIYARQDLITGFAEPHPARYFPGAPSTRLRSDPRPYTPWKDELTREEYLAFWRKVSARLPSFHKGCDQGHGGVCPRQKEYIVKQVDQLMMHRIGAAAHERLQAKHEDLYAGLKFVWPPMLATFALTWTQFGGGAEYRVAFLVVFWIVLAICSIGFLVNVFPGLLSAGPWSVAAGVLGWSGSQLDRKRPLHPFRIAAVGLFIAGNLIKLVVGS